MITTITVSSSTGVSDEYHKAADAARRAILELPEAKKVVTRITKTAEGTLVTYTGLERSDLIYVSWAIPLAAGKLSTKPFKNLKVSGDNWVIRPEIEYKFSDQNVESMLLFNYRF